jgi:TRAP-type C4-dicarboxylate transport system permease small subunit
VRRILTAIETIAAFFLLAIALLTFFNVLARDLFSVQIPDWFDFSKLLQVIAVFWGVALTTLAGRHICVDIVWEHVGPKARRAIDVFATLVIVAFLTPMAWKVIEKISQMGTQSTADLRLPVIYFYWVAAAGAVAACILALWRLVQVWREEASSTPDASSNSTAHGG